MKCATLELGSGRIHVLDIAAPGPQVGSILVSTRSSVISAGTEGMLITFGRSGPVNKIRAQPDRVKQVIDKIATDGLVPTLEAVRDKLSTTMSPGYCQAGIVLDAGGTGPFTAGDRVVTNGPHAEVVRIPHNLAARIPDGVSFESAAFTPLAAIALQGLRLVDPELGETIVVFGLGLVGQLAVQLVRANGCRCIGLDTDPRRVRLAESFGAIGIQVGEGSLVDAVMEHTGGVGADAVLMTLAADSHEPVHQAAAMSRKRGRIVLVGVTGLNLRRDDFYEKELSFQVSCSYGPGRHDPRYEQDGHDYPLPFVRWTEQRNFEAVLGQMASGHLDVEPLISHRFSVEEVPAAYDLLLGDEPSLGIVLEYPDAPDAGKMPTATIALPDSAHSRTAGKGVAGVLGAGNFARRVLIPAARAAGFEIRTVVSSTGLSAAVEGKQAGAAFASSDAKTVFDDPEIDTVFVLTRHDTHAELVRRALEAGKHVFVEKPLALSVEDLRQVKASLEEAGGLLTVGFNRRFAPLATDLAEVVNGRSGPLSLIATVNAGHIPVDHWTQNPDIGGGRIVGEACHFIDLTRFLAGSRIVDLSVRPARDRHERRIDDIAHLTLAFESGSTAVIHYLANGSSRFPKERIEAFFDGKTARIDNWRRLRVWGLGKRFGFLPRRMDKGHEVELAAFFAAVRAGGPPPIPVDEMFEVSEWSIRAAQLARGEMGFQT